MAPVYPTTIARIFFDLPLEATSSADSMNFDPPRMHTQTMVEPGSRSLVHYLGILYALFFFLLGAMAARPDPSKRNFVSPSIERVLADTAARMKDPVLAAMFTQVI